jgi:hypothetical protein
MFGCWVRKEDYVKCNTQCIHTEGGGGTVQQTGRHNNKQNRRHLQKRSANPHSSVFLHKETQFEKQVVKSLGCVGGLKTEAARENNACEGCAVCFKHFPFTRCMTQHAGGFGTKVGYNWSNRYRLYSDLHTHTHTHTHTDSPVESGAINCTQLCLNQRHHRKMIITLIGVSYIVTIACRVIRKLSQYPTSDQELRLLRIKLSNVTISKPAV